MGYLGSEQHKQNAANARIKAVQKSKLLAKTRKEEYYKNPIKCKNCEKPIPYEKKRYNTFCSKSCSAQAGNKSRGKRSKETKLKISATMKQVSKRQFETGKRIRTGQTRCRVSFKNCKICNKLFTVKNYNETKTCSRECMIKAKQSRSYQNGSRKTYYYKGVILESSWELEIAKLLDKRKIEWIRPKPIPWTDKKNKTRLYYPDFYLPEYNLYLDPKNPYCMELDKTKMEEISKKVSIEYGDIQKIKRCIGAIHLPS